MKKAYALFAATFALVLVCFGFTAPTKASEIPAQAWYYSTCTQVGMDGYKWCYRQCTFSHERYTIGGCATWIRVSVWNA